MIEKRIAMRYTVCVELSAGGFLNGSQLQKALDCNINDIKEFVDEDEVNR